MYSVLLLSSLRFRPYPKFGTYSRPRGYKGTGVRRRHYASRIAGRFCVSAQHLVKDRELMKAVRRKYQRAFVHLKILINKYVYLYLWQNVLFLYFGS